MIGVKISGKERRIRGNASREYLKELFFLQIHDQFKLKINNSQNIQGDSETDENFRIYDSSIFVCDNPFLNFETLLTQVDFS